MKGQLLQLLQRHRTVGNNYAKENMRNAIFTNQTIFIEVAESP